MVMGPLFSVRKPHTELGTRLRAPTPIPKPKGRGEPKADITARALARRAGHQSLTAVPGCPTGPMGPGGPGGPWGRKECQRHQDSERDQGGMRLKARWQKSKVTDTYMFTLVPFSALLSRVSHLTLGGEGR